MNTVYFLKYNSFGKLDFLYYICKIMFEPIIDFTVFNREGFFDPYTLYIADNSAWVHLEEKPSVIEIYTPGSKAPVVNYFDKKSINNFNSIGLNLNCPTDCGIELQELPDGIYNITLKASPSSFFKNKKHLRTTKIRLEIAKYLISLNLGCESKESKDQLQKIMEINLLLDSAEANVIFDNLQTANEEYQLAKRKVEKLTNCKNCW